MISGRLSNMKKSERQVEALIASLIECVNIEHVIDSLPRGYISVKVISGHTYYYRQWREGNKIISNYVPETYLNVTKQKIAIRKQNEELLKILKKDYKKAERSVLRTGALNNEQIVSINEKIRTLNITEENHGDILNDIINSL